MPSSPILQLDHGPLKGGVVYPVSLSGERITVLAKRYGILLDKSMARSMAPGLFALLLFLSPPPRPEKWALGVGGLALSAIWGTKYGIGANRSRELLERALHRYGVKHPSFARFVGEHPYLYVSPQGWVVGLPTRPSSFRLAPTAVVDSHHVWQGLRPRGPNVSHRARIVRRIVR